MQTTYKRELKAKSYLDSQSIECFVPMKQVTIIERGKRRVVSKPAIHNLIFMKADYKRLLDIKLELDYLHNQLRRSNGALIPIVVPTTDMEQFIATSLHAPEKLEHIDITDLKLEENTRVRIIDGEFKGHEGFLTKIKGKRNKRVVVNIEGLVAFCLEVKPDHINLI